LVLGLRGSVALAILALSASALPASARTTCGRPAAVRSGRWFVSEFRLAAHSPAHQTVHGDVRRLRATALDPVDPRVAVVTDGERVLRSDDGGCSWHQVWALPDGPPGSAADGPDRDISEITSVDVAHVAGRSRVLLAVMGNGWGSTYGARSYLVRSDDGRTGWTLVGDAATLTGPYDHQQGSWPPVVHSVGEAAYAAVSGPLGTVSYVRSNDGGRTWAARSDATDLGAPTGMTGFAVSPWSPDELWEWGGTRSKAGDTLPGLRHSADGGRTWRAIAPWAAFGTWDVSWSTADVAWPRRGAPARLLVLGGTSTASGATPPLGVWSGDGGATFRQVIPGTRQPLVHAAVTHLASGDAVVVTENGESFAVRCALTPPSGADWRPLPRAPKPPAASWSVLGPDLARVGGTAPGVVGVPTTAYLQLLSVAR
jgi:hypothetical protein